MNLIDKSITDILSGYNYILQAETTMRNRWRMKLLTTYSHRISLVGEERRTSKKRQIQSLISIFMGIGFTIIGIGFSCRGIIHYEENILWYCCGGPLLGFLGILILGATWFSQKSTSKPRKKRAALHPLKSGSRKQNIYPDLRVAWMQGLSGVLEDQVPDYPAYFDNNEKDYGAQGERIFIQRLNDIFDDHTYILSRLMVRPREDVDIILIGPKGVWVFEVKHWSGEIYWDDLGWRRVQTYYERGGVEVTKQPDIGEPPDNQWVRSASQVRRSLKNDAPDILARYPVLEQVRGGIVFSKEEAILNFQPRRPVYWGTLNFWIKTLHDVEPKAKLDTNSALKLVDMLLIRHHELTQTLLKRSMLDYAHTVEQEADKRLHAWAQM